MKLITVFLFLVLFSNDLFAQTKAPACLDKKERMEFNDNRLLLYRDEMEKKFTARGFIKGTLISVIEDRQKHVHFEVDLDEDLQTTDDRLEVIYNTKFGPLPEFNAGDEIIACGDFVVDPYSPHGAVLHWLHSSPELKKHEHGYLMINGIIAGNEIPLKEMKK